jgi:hypothetical protein
MGARLITLVAALLAGAAHAAPLTVAQLQADFQLARRALEEAHGGIYRYTPKAELDQVFDAAAARLDRPMAARALRRILAPAVAALRCGHTALLPSPALTAELDAALLLPLEVKLIGARLYIVRDFDGAGKLAGREITAINGMSAPAIIARLTAAAPGDGFIATARAQRVARKFREELFTQLGMQDRFTLTLRGELATVTLAGQRMAALTLLTPARSTRFAALSLLIEGRIAHLKIFNFSDEDEDDEGAVILKEAFESIAASGARTLLLDLRDNGGGQDVLGKHVFAHLVPTPFPYYEQLTVRRPVLSFVQHLDGAAGIPVRALTLRPDGSYGLNGHPNLGLQQPAVPTFGGKVIALINGRSFSTTAELITQLHDKRRATFVGEESGGAYHGNSSGSEAMLVLPHSRLRLAIPLVTYTLAVNGAHPNGRGVVPDVGVAPTIDDYLAGRDVVLERAIALAR